MFDVNDLSSKLYMESNKILELISSLNEKNFILDEMKYFEKKQIFLIIITGKHAFEKIRKNIEILNYETFVINDSLKVRNDLEMIKDISGVDKCSPRSLQAYYRRTCVQRGWQTGQV